MEFVIGVAEAHKLLLRIFALAPPKNSGGSDIGVCVEAAGNTVKARIHTNEIVAVSEVEAKVVSSGSAVVSLAVFYKAITGFSVYKSDTGVGTKVLKIRKGTQSLTITAKTFYGSRTANNRRVLQFLDTIIPSFEVVSENEFVGIPINVLSVGLHKVLFSLSNNTDPTGLSGVLIKASNKNIKFVSTNSISLTECSSLLNKSVPEMECVLTSAFVAKFSRVLSKFTKGDNIDTINFLATEKMFIFKTEDLLVGVPLVNRDFPEYKQLLNRGTKTFVIDSTILLDNLRNILYNADKEDDFRTTLNFCKGELLIRTQTCENDSIRLEGDSKDDLHADFNIYLLESCVRNMGDGLISFIFENSHSPVVVKTINTGKEENKILSILAPLK